MSHHHLLVNRFENDLNFIYYFNSMWSHFWQHPNPNWECSWWSWWWFQGISNQECGNHFNIEFCKFASQAVEEPDAMAGNWAYSEAVSWEFSRALHWYAEWQMAITLFLKEDKKKKNFLFYCTNSTDITLKNVSAMVSGDTQEVQKRTAENYNNKNWRSLVGKPE